MTCALIYLNPSIFLSPYEFIPERWLENPRLDRYLCSFSKGPCQCLSINLAYAELYLCVAGLFRRYGEPGNAGPKGAFDLFKTTREDVEMKHDLFLPFPKKDSKGVRIVLK
jgi:cytochrome P450